MFENINHGESNTYKTAKMFTRYVLAKYILNNRFFFLQRKSFHPLPIRGLVPFSLFCSHRKSTWIACKVAQHKIVDVMWFENWIGWSIGRRSICCAVHVAKMAKKLQQSNRVADFYAAYVCVFSVYLLPVCVWGKVAQMQQVPSIKLDIICFTYSSAIIQHWSTIRLTFHFPSKANNWTMSFWSTQLSLAVTSTTTLFGCYFNSLSLARSVFSILSSFKTHLVW